MSEGDRRAPGATRIPFEAMVEVGGSTGPAFEAQAIDVSRSGMHLRTAYLPEVGQPLTCRFDAGPREMVLASGEVVWSREAARGGEFGIRFANLDADSARVLGRMACVPQDPSAPRADVPGMKVRLHIDGLGSPMRARVKGVNHAELTVGSELGFLQVGKELELEHADTGTKRHARIDRVEVQVDPESRVPELVVALRYSDETTPADMASVSALSGRYHDESAHRSEPAHRMEERHDVDSTADTIPADPTFHTSNATSPNSSPDVDVDMTDDAADGTQPAADRVKSAFSRSAAKVAPAIHAFTARAKTTFALLAARKWRDKGEAKDDVAIPMRRVTAPPPGGGLHAEGRKVVRDFSAMRDGFAEKAPAFVLDKKKMIAGGAIGALLIIGAVAMRKPSAPPPAADNASATAPIASGALADNAGAANAPGAGSNAPNPALAAPPPVVPPPAPAVDTRASNDTGFTETLGPRPEYHAPKRVQVAPFSNGAVAHGNVLRLKMDAPIEKIQGAAQPTGFTVVIPSRRSLEAAAPLAARDGRIASIKVVNDSAGAELSVTFKDGVPNYLVRAKGETLEIVLAPVGRIGDRPAVADAHDGARAHTAPSANAKHKRAAPRHH